MNKITIHSTSWDKSFSLISYTRFCLSLNSFIFIKQTSPLKLKFKSPNFHAFTLFHHLMLHWLSKSQVFVSSCSYICLIVNSKSKSEYFLVYPLYIRYGDDDIEKCSWKIITDQYWVGYFWWNVPYLRYERNRICVGCILWKYDNLKMHLSCAFSLKGHLLWSTLKLVLKFQFDLQNPLKQPKMLIMLIFGKMENYSFWPKLWYFLPKVV